jgi:hypothetical protein
MQGWDSRRKRDVLLCGNRSEFVSLLWVVRKESIERISGGERIVSAREATTDAPCSKNADWESTNVPANQGSIVISPAKRIDLSFIKCLFFKLFEELRRYQVRNVLLLRNITLYSRDDEFVCFKNFRQWYQPALFTRRAGG